MKQIWRKMTTWGLAVAVMGLAPLARGVDEVPLTDNDFKKLDTFEGHELAKADKVFAAKEYRRAIAEYESFLTQYPRSGASAYALLRKGRSLMLDNKRGEAIKTFREVLDYFPNAVEYASAALFYMGQCHWDNSDVKQAMTAWSELADDEEYRKQPLAAGAINGVADNLIKQGKLEKAGVYYRQVAIDFRRTNREAAYYALGKAVAHYTRTQPNEPVMAEFFKQVQGFGWDWMNTPPTEDDYWTQLRACLRENGKFEPVQANEREAYYRYWAGVMEGKRVTDDDFQIDWAYFRKMVDLNETAWMSRLDQQYVKFQKDGDYSRTVKWIAAYREQKSKVNEYYGRLDFAKMSNAQIAQLVEILLSQAKDSARARNTFDKLRPSEMSDAEKYAFVMKLWNLGDDYCLAGACQGWKDKSAGQELLLRYWHQRWNVAQGVPLADELAKDPKYAKTAYFRKGELLQSAGKYPEAIAAYQASDSPPDSAFRIAECFQAQGKVAPAIAQLREIENFFPANAGQACLRIAYIQKALKDQKLYVAELRGLLKKYPKSAESSTAHQELQAMGLKTGGGTDEI